MISKHVAFLLLLYLFHILNVQCTATNSKFRGCLSCMSPDTKEDPPTPLAAHKASPRIVHRRPPGHDAKMPSGTKGERTYSLSRIYNMVKRKKANTTQLMDRAEPVGLRIITEPAQSMDNEKELVGLRIVTEPGTKSSSGSSIFHGKKIAEEMMKKSHDNGPASASTAVEDKAEQKQETVADEKRKRMQMQIDRGKWKHPDEHDGTHAVEEGIPIHSPKKPQPKLTEGDEAEPNDNEKSYKSQNSSKYWWSKVRLSFKSKVVIGEIEARKREKKIEAKQTKIKELEAELEKLEAQLRKQESAEERKLIEELTAEVKDLLVKQHLDEVKALEETAKQSEAELAALCHPEVLIELGHGGAPSAENDEASAPGKSDNPGSGDSRANAAAASKDAKTHAVPNKDTQTSIGFRDAIRFALRHFFCDAHFNKGVEWTRVLSNEEEAEAPIERFEKDFKKNDPTYPHTYKNDFKFTIFYPDKFKKLWDIYGANERDLLASLTKRNLKGFKNQAQSGSWMANSWDGKYFLKTVKTVPKKFLFVRVEDTLEKDFFFQVNGRANNHTYKSWPKTNDNKYKGAFEKYFQSMLDFKQETLLPKFFMLFGFEDKGQFPQFVTIQNYIFPADVPIHYKFDLKGSTVRRLFTQEHLSKLKLEKGQTPMWMDQDFIRHEKEMETTGFFRNGIQLDEKEREKLNTIIERDCLLLKEMNIVDYSLLLGVHFVKSTDNSIEQGYQASCINCEELDPNMPENELKKLVPTNEGLKNKIYTEVKHNLRIFIGIIDILQDYNTYKDYENKLKTTFTGSENTSANVFPIVVGSPKEHPLTTIVEPGAYQRRFLSFVKDMVFPAIQKNEEVENLE